MGFKNFNCPYRRTAPEGLNQPAGAVFRAENKKIQKIKIFFDFRLNFLLRSELIYRGVNFPYHLFPFKNRYLILEN